MYKIYWNWNMKNDNMIYNKMITWYEKKKNDLIIHSLKIFLIITDILTLDI